MNSFHPLQRCRSEEEMLKFMGLMNSSWVLDGHDIATAFNLSSFHSIVDLGGQRSNFDVDKSFIAENRCIIQSLCNRKTRQIIATNCVF